MKIRFALITLAAVLLGGFLSGSASAQTAGLKSKVTGTWTVDSAYNILPDGRRIEPQGPNGKGMFILASNGHFTWILLRPDIPKFASNNRLDGTPQEYAATATGTLAYYGTYSVKDSDNSLTMKIELARFI